MNVAVQKPAEYTVDVPVFHDLKSWAIYKSLIGKTKAIQHRWPGLNKIMDKYAKKLIDLCSDYQEEIFKALGLPSSEKIRRSILDHDTEPGSAFTWTPDKSRKYRDLIAGWELEVLGVNLSRKGISTNERGIFVNLLDAVLGLAVDQLLRDAIENAPDYVDANELETIRAGMAERGAEFLMDYVAQHGGERIRTTFAVLHMGEIVDILSGAAGTGQGVMEVGRELFNRIGEGASWYWNMVARSEGALAVNAAYDAAVKAYGIPYERWVATAGCCEVCDELDGEMWVAGEGPRPVSDTHPNCLCSVVPVWEGEHDVNDAYDEPSPYGD